MPVCTNDYWKSIRGLKLSPRLKRPLIAEFAYFGMHQRESAQSADWSPAEIADLSNRRYWRLEPGLSFNLRFFFMRHIAFIVDSIFYIVLINKIKEINRKDVSWYKCTKVGLSKYICWICWSSNKIAIRNLLLVHQYSTRPIHNNSLIYISFPSDHLHLFW